METKTNLEIALDWEDKITLELHRQLMTKYYPNKKPSQVTDDELLHIWECEVNAPKEGGTAEPETQNDVPPVQGAALEGDCISFIKAELSETHNFLKNDIGRLSMTEDPLQILSFTRGKQAAYCMALGRIEPELAALRRDNEVLRGMLFDIVAFYYQGEFKESFKMILPEIKELLTPKP